MKLKFLILLLVIFFPQFAKANKQANKQPTNPRLAISSWEEETNLNITGKSSEILVRGKVQDFLPNQVMTSFSIGFDQNRKIKITRVICDGVNANYTFQKNNLTINFSTPKPNNQKVSFYFAFEETYEKINKFLRQEAIIIPSFAAGADSEVVINFPGSLESATLNPNITKNGNSFVYKNLVSKKGVNEIIKLTPAQSVWNVNLSFKATANKPLNQAKIIMPIYFKNAGQKVENFITKSSVEPTEKITDNQNKIFKFNAAPNEILVENLARISTGKINKTPIARTPANYLTISSQEAILLKPILQKIEQDPKYLRLPLHAKIGQFVHDYIKYDINYIGKLLPLSEIIQNRTGVCTEYAKLYNALARLANIPSIYINGGACGEYDKCMGHAWNLIYIDGAWIEVDPTWNLMSGVVSSSHVFFSENDTQKVLIEYLDDKKIVTSKVDFVMKEGL